MYHQVEMMEEHIQNNSEWKYYPYLLIILSQWEHESK